jgi:predicted secreted protein
MKRLLAPAVLAAGFVLATPLAFAAAETALLMPVGPSIAVTGAATTTVANDRMVATLRAEGEHANAASAASEVNARMAKVLAKAKAVAGVETRSAGYSTWQVWEKGRPARWKVVQSISLTGGDFAALAALVSRLQDEDGLLVSGIAFSVAPDTRRRAEEALMREAIRAWQQRASTAADALGYASWHAGRLSVSTGDAGIVPRTEMMMRAQAAPAGGAPIAIEGGTTELTVTVSGDAQLDSPRTR